MSHHSNSDDDDDDFGNFSDASFESEDTTTQLTETLVNSALDKLFGNESFHYKIDPQNNDDNPNKILAGLLADERPNVIYNQLVDSDNRDIPAFIWNRSNLRSTLLHILRLKDPQTALDTKNTERIDSQEKHLSAVTMDDSLYVKVMDLVKDIEKPLKDNTLILREQFDLAYMPPLTQPSLAADLNRELKERIPSLLGETNNNEEYHDMLCNAIDLLILELRSLYERQLELEADKQTYERVITNLSGHTQRLQRDEIAMFNKKKTQYKRWHRFSWGGK
ncbi:similar to Saccharomyces cerevisiae YBL010C Putative protein of unknown function [Maudiozyma saulgeensis]|uniref:Uncharacterized protein n=1 Tax=Maudiozyma saulgeensis TaxID=1789683 RepID=A0A1X7R5K3_9SACH|nr:similar to Saccharomyces cerevisiae YBL010C Putative protein of unknown function [Kazachstania saulgeensis]